MYVSSTEVQTVNFLKRLRRAVIEGRVEIRSYAREGLRDLGWSTEDLRFQLLDLTYLDLLRTEKSTAAEGGLVWIFTPEFWEGGHLWIRLIERAGVVVIGFHKG